MGEARPLQGVTVVDMTTSYAGPTATMYLADMGADVIKVERPGDGDDVRHWGPPFRSGWSAWYASVNRSKRTIVLDVSKQDGREILDQLLDRADVFVHNLNPSKLGRLQLEPDMVRKRHPRLVYCSISGFGLAGRDRDLPGYDLIAQARSGMMSVTGEQGRSPQRMSTALTDIATGMVAAFTISAALVDQARSGRGVVIDVALFDVGLALMAPRIAAFLAGDPEPQPSGATDSVLAIYQVVQTSDRPIVVAAGNEAMWRRLCVVLGLHDLMEDPRLSSNEHRRSHRSEIVERMERVLRAAPAEEWLERFADAGIPSSLVKTLSEVVTDPHIADRSGITSVPTDGGEEFLVVNQPWRLDGKAAEHKPVRAIGADTKSVLADLGTSADSAPPGHA
jgi:crotonobetainyl-CoA:carnitine CoA-transferase CaiB-like acyl-CoA transferase